MNIKQLLRLVTIGMAMSMSVPALAAEVDSSIARCLKAWGKQPFGANPRYKTLSTSVKVFGDRRRTPRTRSARIPRRLCWSIRA